MAFLYAVETIWDHNPSPEELLEFDITDEEAIEFRTKISHPDYLGIAEIYHMRGDRKRMEEYIALGFKDNTADKERFMREVVLKIWDNPNEELDVS